MLPTPIDEAAGGHAVNARSLWTPRQIPVGERLHEGDERV
jgi:hypothetical protein